MEKSAEVEDLKFQWGKKRGTNKDVQFYESFTCGGFEYCLYDCVSICDANTPDSLEFFIGKIIKMWEHNDQRQNPRRIELLWFFKPSEISTYLNGVQDVLPNELFLASGTGKGLTNENQLESIYGKCHVLCISKDARNPQPSDEEIKLADFLFRRTFDVGTCKISEKIDDKIAGVDVKFIFNRTSSEKKASAVQKVATNPHGTADRLKPNLPSTSGSVRQNEHNGSDFSGHRKSDYGYKKEEDNECHKQLARKKSTLAEERSNKDSGRRDGELDYCHASGSRRNDFHGNKYQENKARYQLTKQKSRLAEERCSKDSYCLDDLPQKKWKLDGSVAVSDRRTKNLQNISHDSRKDIRPIRSSRDKATAGEVYSQKSSFADKKEDLRRPRYSEGKETKTASENGLFKKPKQTEGKMLTDANYGRHYRVFEVTQKLQAEESKWYRNLPWEENLRCAEGQGNLVLLQNLDPTYTSKEVENIVYSSLNEQSTARMIERTSYNIPHIGEALVIFKTMDAAKRAIRRLDEGCLLLSNGRTLVATNAKVNPPAKSPLRFTGHIKLIAQIRKGMNDAVATSHSAQRNTIEFDLGMEWCLHQSIFEQTWKKIFERQFEEMRRLKMKVKPKRA